MKLMWQWRGNQRIPRMIMHVWKSEYSMKNDQSESGAYLSIKRSMCSHKKLGQCTIKSINITHMSLNQAQKSSHVTIHSNWFFILKKILWCRAPTKALLFCMNQFHKFHHLELRNLILAYLKHFENQRNCESHWPKERMAVNFIWKVNFWDLKP